MILLFQLGLYGSILILVTALLRTFSAKYFPKYTFSILWMICTGRLLLLPNVSSPFSIYNIVKYLVSWNAPESIGNTQTVFPLAQDLIPTSMQSQLSHLAFIWFTGMVFCILFFTVTHLRFRRKFREAIPIENTFAYDWLCAHPLKRNIRLHTSDRIHAPLTYGVLHPVILFPKAFDWSDQTKLQYVLAHEYVHIRRFDVLAKLLILVAICVHWWNPLVWFMALLANRDMELSCDETVVHMHGETARKLYALTLIGMEEQKRTTPLCSNFNNNAIEERITAIMNMKKLSLKGSILAITLVAATTSVFATSASTPKEIPATLLIPAMTTASQDGAESDQNDIPATKIQPNVVATDENMTSSVVPQSDVIPFTHLILLTDEQSETSDASIPTVKFTKSILLEDSIIDFVPIEEISE